jgi:septal ring factor EnvC (AmiA/AmiB activator)
MLHLLARRLLMPLFSAFLVMVTSGGLITWSRSSTAVVHASTVDDLSAKKKALEQSAAQAEQDANLQKSVAQRAAEKIQQVSGQIDNLSSVITDTDQSISDITGKIDEQNQNLDKLESILRGQKDQQNAVVRVLAEKLVSTPDILALFSNESISKRQADTQELNVLQRSVAAMYTKTIAAKSEVEKNKAELAKKSEELQSLKSQQEEQKRGLADVQDQQAALKDDAETAVVNLEAKARKARADEAGVEQQISAALTAAIRANASRGSVAPAPGTGGRVSRGMLVGHLGSTGNSSGPHVHFECRVGGSPVSCAPYVNNGTLTWPVSDFVISQGFGYTDYAAGGAYGGSIHTGIDLAGPYGQPVYAPANGTVILKQYYGGYGNAWAEQLDSGLVVLLGHMTGN